MDSIRSGFNLGRYHMGKCAECRFWVKDDDDLGFCHANPPTIQESSREEGCGYFGIWPKTSEEDWCGKFQEK